MRTGLKSAGSLRVGISVSPSPEVAGTEGGGGRRRSETIGFFTTKLRSEVDGAWRSGMSSRGRM